MAKKQTLRTNVCERIGFALEADEPSRVKLDSFFLFFLMFSFGNRRAYVDLGKQHGIKKRRRQRHHQTKQTSDKKKAIAFIFIHRSMARICTHSQPLEAETDRPKARGNKRAGSSDTKREREREREDRFGWRSRQKAKQQTESERKPKKKPKKK